VTFRVLETWTFCFVCEKATMRPSTSRCPNCASESVNELLMDKNWDIVGGEEE